MKKKRDRKAHQISKLKWFDHICLMIFPSDAECIEIPFHYFVATALAVSYTWSYFKLSARARYVFQAIIWATTFSFYIFTIVSSSSSSWAAAAASAKAQAVAFWFSYWNSGFLLAICSSHVFATFCHFFFSSPSFWSLSLLWFLVHFHRAYSSSFFFIASVGRFDEPLFQC